MMRLSTEDNGDGAGEADRAAAPAIPLLALLLLVAIASLVTALAVLVPAPPSALMDSNEFVSGSASGREGEPAGLRSVGERAAVRWSNAAGEVTALHSIASSAAGSGSAQREAT